jgi:hypothetical protein
MPPYSCRQQNRRCPDFCPYYHNSLMEFQLEKFLFRDALKKSGMAGGIATEA